MNLKRFNRFRIAARLRVPIVRASMCGGVLANRPSTSKAVDGISRIAKKLLKRRQMGKKRAALLKQRTVQQKKRAADPLRKKRHKRCRPAGRRARMLTPFWSERFFIGGVHSTVFEHASQHCLFSCTMCWRRGYAIRCCAGLDALSRNQTNADSKRMEETR